MADIEDTADLSGPAVFSGSAESVRSVDSGKSVESDRHANSDQIDFAYFDAFFENVSEDIPFSDAVPYLRKFGYSGILLMFSDISRLKEKLPEFTSASDSFIIRTCAEIRVPDAGKLGGKVSSAKSAADFVAVRSSDEKVMRAAVESSNVDILIPFENGKVGVINQVVAKCAADNNVAFAFETSVLINSRGYRRARYLAGISDMVPILRKYNVPIFLISGAKSPYEFRDVLVLEAFGSLFTLTPEESRKACSSNYLEMIRYADMKRSGRCISKGIEIVETQDSFENSCNNSCNNSCENSLNDSKTDTVE